MVDYKKMYNTLFNAVTDAERSLEEATVILRIAQQKCEDIYIETDDAQIFLPDMTDKKELSYKE